MWERNKDADVLGPLFSSTGVNIFWLLSRYEENQDKAEAENNRQEARRVWDVILDTTKARPPHGQKKSLAQSWRDLAKDLNRFAKQRKRRDESSLARTIVDAATELER